MKTLRILAILPLAALLLCCSSGLLLGKGFCVCAFPAGKARVATSYYIVDDSDAQHICTGECRSRDGDFDGNWWNEK